MEPDADVLVARRLGIETRVLALVLASGWTAVERPSDPFTDDPFTDDPWDVRAVTQQDTLDDGDTDWYVAGTPSQLMLGLRPGAPPLLARPAPGWRGPAERCIDPVDPREIPGLVGCPDVDGDRAVAVRAVRDTVLRRARRHLTWCRSCLTTVHKADTSGDLCHACAQVWLGILY